MHINNHSKDILFKALSEKFKNEALDVMGLKFPKIKRLLPTEQPKLIISVKHSDMLFELENGELLLLEFESDSNIVENFLNKYLEYINRIVLRYWNETKSVTKIILVVVYSSEISESGKLEQLDAGCLTLKAQSVYLSEFFGEERFDQIKAKILSGNDIDLTVKELVNFILLPLMKFNKSKRETLEDCFELAKQIPNENTMLSAVSGLLASGSKYIDNEFMLKIEEWISMLDTSVLDRAIENVANRRAEKMAEKMAEEMAEKMAEEMAEKMAEEMAEKMAEEMAIEMSIDMTNERLKEVAKNFLTVLQIEQVAKSMNLTVEEIQLLVQ